MAFMRAKLKDRKGKYGMGIMAALNAQFYVCVFLYLQLKTFFIHRFYSSTLVNCSMSTNMEQFTSVNTLSTVSAVIKTTAVNMFIFSSLYLTLSFLT